MARQLKGHSFRREARGEITKQKTLPAVARRDSPRKATFLRIVQQALHHRKPVDFGFQRLN